MVTAIRWTALAVAIGAGAFGISTLIVHADIAKERNQQFAGACILLHGQVHDNLCVKGKTVVLTKSEFEKETKTK